MKRYLVIVIFCLAFSSNGLAQDSAASAPASKEDIQRYLDALHSHEMMQNMMAAMAKPMHQSISEQFAKDKDKLPADFEAHMNKLIDDLLKDMPFDEMMQAAVPVYQKHFTKGDVDSLVAFYTSPTGQKMLHELPAIMAESMQAMIPVMRQHMDKVNQRVQQEVAEMLKNNQKKPVSTSPAT
jgi:hypothetical protein